MTDHTRAMLEEAWEHCAQTDKPFRRFACAIIDERGTTNAGKFARLLDAEAYLDAAVMLVPEGWGMALAVDPNGKTLCGLQRKNGAGYASASATAPTPALALLAAITKAKNDE